METYFQGLCLMLFHMEYFEYGIPLLIFEIH